MPTPNIDAAIREGCSLAWRGEDCTYPACDCAPVVPDMIKTALRTVLPKEPPAEVIEAMALVMLVANGHPPPEFGSPASVGWRASSWWLARLHDARQLTIVAYKAQPIYRELWGEE